VTTKGTSDDAEAFFVVTDWKWTDANKHFIAPSTHWKKYSLSLNPGELDYAEVRFVIQAQGDFRITNVSVRGPLWRRVV